MVELETFVTYLDAQKVHLGLLIKQPLGDVHKWRK